MRYLASYYDAVVREPERLAIDLLLDAVADGARAANYVEVVQGRHGDAIELRDTITGRTFEFRAPVVINVTGPWADATNQAIGHETAFVGGTRGSHIVLDNPELLAATGGDEIFFEHADGRIVLILPLAGRVLVGTSDLWHDIREPAVCTEDEVDYFLALVHHVFPSIGVERSQIVHAFSGVRPPAAGRRREPGLRVARLPRGGSAARRGREHAAHRRRWQMDDVPRARRTGDGPGARRPRSPAHRIHVRAAHRRRA